MRILTASFHHESNSFNPIVTGPDDFTIFYGKEIYNNLNDRDSISGIIHTLEKAGVEIIPTVFARAVPNGLVKKSLYRELKKNLRIHLLAEKKSEPVHGAVLALHGSMRVEELGEAEGDILALIHEVFPDMPVFVALDMHTSFSADMHRLAHYIAYKCAPHTDCYETGARAAGMALQIVPEAKPLANTWISLPLLITGEKSETSTEPMKSLIQGLHECERIPGIYGASYLMGFPWADNEDNTVSVLVEAEDKPLAEMEAKKLAEQMWEKRDQFQFHCDTYYPEEILDHAFNYIEKEETPVYISDSGDNPTAGSSGDVTTFLSQLLNDDRLKKLKSPLLYGGIYDPASVKKCRNKTGEYLSLYLGASFDRKTSAPIEWGVKVKAFVEDYRDTGGLSRGSLALVSLGTVDLVLTARHIGFTDPEMFRALGAKPEEREIIVCKLGYLTTPHKKIARTILMALTPGSSNEDLKKLPYRHIKRPVFPLDREAAFTPFGNK